LPTAIKELAAARPSRREPSDTQRLRDYLDSEDFNHIAYAYRTASTGQAEVRFQVLQQAIIAALLPPEDGQP
jgi:hypothetical protein